MNYNQRCQHAPGGFQQEQQAGQWPRPVQGQSQFYQTNMGMSQSLDQTARGQSNTFQNFQQVPGCKQIIQYPHPNIQQQTAVQESQESFKKHHFEEQQRKLKEISSRGFKAKPKDGKHLFDDFLSKTDLDLSTGLKQIPKSIQPGVAGVGMPNQHQFSGYQSSLPSTTDPQMPGFSAQQSIGQIPSHFASSRGLPLQRSASSDFQPYHASSSTCNPGMITPASSKTEDEFGDFQGGLSSNAQPVLVSQSQSFTSLSGIQSSQGLQTFVGAPLIDAKSNVLPAMHDNQQKKLPDAFDASFFNLPSQITGKTFVDQSLTTSSLPKSQNAELSSSGPGFQSSNWDPNQAHQAIRDNQGKENFQQIREIQPDFRSQGTDQPVSFCGPALEEEDMNSPEKLYGSKLPAWCTEIHNLPAVYKKVLERSLAPDGSIDTKKLYSLLLASNVAKDKLRDIWGMANRKTPGVLTEEELYIVLGLIALAQAGWSKLSISKLVSCNTAPIPEFPEYLFMDIEKESVFGGEALSTDDWSSNRSESPVDPNDKYSVFKSYEKTRPASISSLERQVSNSSLKDNAEWSTSHGLSVQSNNEDKDISQINQQIQDKSEVKADWANFKSADKGDLFVASTAHTSTSFLPIEPSIVKGFSGSLKTSETEDFTSFVSFSAQTADKNPPTYFGLDSKLQPTSKHGESTKQFASLQNPQNELKSSQNNDDDFGDFLSIQSNKTAPTEFPLFSSTDKQEGLLNSSHIDILPTSNIISEIKSENGPIKHELLTPSVVLDVPILSSNDNPKNTVMDDSWDDFTAFSSASHQTAEASLSSKPTASFITSSFGSINSHNDIKKDESQMKINDNSSFASFNLSSTFDSNKVGKEPSESLFDIDSSSSSKSKEITNKEISNFDLLDQGPVDIFSQDQSGGKEFASFGNGKEGDPPKLDVDYFQPQNSEIFSSLKTVDALQHKNGSKFSDKNFGLQNDGRRVVDQDSLLGSFAKPLSANESDKTNIKKQMIPLNIDEDKKENISPEPVLEVGNRYKALSGVLEESDRHVHEWKRCLKSIKKVLNTTASIIKARNLSLHSKQEVFESEKGREFFNGLREIFAVTCRVKMSINNSAFARTNDEIKSCINEVDKLWREVCSFSSGLPQYALPESPRKLETTSADDSSPNSLCGLCLLNVHIQPIDFNGFTISTATLTYGGRTYHSACANFWCNKVNPVLPCLPPLVSGLL